MGAAGAMVESLAPASPHSGPRGAAGGSLLELAIYSVFQAIKYIVFYRLDPR